MFDSIRNRLATVSERRKEDYIAMAIATVLVAIMISVLAGHTSRSVFNRFDDAVSTGDAFALVERDNGTNMSVYADVTNGVQYVSQHGKGVSPMLDADGNPIINEQWKEWKDARS